MAQTNLFSRLVGLVTRLFTPEPPAREEVDAQIARLIDAYNGKVDALVAGMEDGKITIGQFVGSMPSLIKEHQLAAAVVASGDANPQVYALAQQKVNEQLAYFDRWKAELLAQSTAGNLPSAEYIANRAKLYGKAANATAQQATTQATGLPTLPQYPADGQTRCKVNCKCSLRIETVDVVNESYNVYWQLGAAEHCPDCVRMSRTWNPLRIRRGEIRNG